MILYNAIFTKNQQEIAALTQLCPKLKGIRFGCKYACVRMLCTCTQHGNSNAPTVFNGKASSPETTREIIQEKKNVKKLFVFTPKPVELTPEWIVGFFEGDGCLNFYKKQQSFSFILRQADPKVLYKIKSFFQLGSVFQDSKGYWTYSIRSKQGLEKVLNLLNGKLVLKKRQVQFQQWVLNYNQVNGTNHVPQNTAASFSWDSAWFCGFADAEGSFNIQLQVRKDSGRDRLRLRFYVDQAYSKECLILLQKFYGGTLGAKSKSHQHYHRLMFDTWKKAPEIIQYFLKFPPLTTCLYVRFLRYVRVYNWYISGDWLQKKPKILHLIQLNKRLEKKKDANFMEKKKKQKEN